MAIGKKERILAALQRVRPLPTRFIEQVEAANDEAWFDQWLGYTKEDWIRRRPDDGDAIYNTLHPQTTRSTDSLITVSSFIEYTLPRIDFSQKATKSKSKTSSRRANPREPKEVAEWTDFIDGALSFRLSSDLESIRVPTPVFLNCKSLTGVEKDVDLAVRTNITLVLSNFLQLTSKSPFQFTPENHVAFKGIPDYLIYKTIDGVEVDLSFIEDKTIRDVPTPTDNESLVLWWKHDLDYEHTDGAPPRTRKSIYNEICQVYGYLAFNLLKYGVLSTYESTWFICRPSPGKMLISPRIACDSKSPTILRSYLYFLSLVDQGHTTQKSPDSTPVSPKKNTTRDTLFSHDFNTRANKRFKSSIPYGFNIADLERPVGSGASGTVYHWTYRGNDVVVKICDRSNHEGYKMIKSEVDVYLRLVALQGHDIPQVHFSGPIAEYFVICMEFIVGEHPERISKSHHGSDIDMQIGVIVKKLKSYGVVHRDLKPSNVIVDTVGHVWLIDFGKCDLE